MAMSVRGIFEKLKGNFWQDSANRNIQRDNASQEKNGLCDKFVTEGGIILDRINIIF